MISFVFPLSLFFTLQATLLKYLNNIKPVVENQQLGEVGMLTEVQDLIEYLGKVQQLAKVQHQQEMGNSVRGVDGGLLVLKGVGYLLSQVSLIVLGRKTQTSNQPGMQTRKGFLARTTIIVL